MSNEEKIKSRTKIPSANIVPYGAPVDGDDHEDLGQPFRVVAKLKNNRLLKAREECGYTSAKKAADAIGVTYQLLLRYEGLQEQPWIAKTGEWRETAHRIAAFYGYAPEELWPDAVKSVKETVTAFEIAEPSVSVFDDPADAVTAGELRGEIKRALHRLSPREREFIERYFGINRPEETYERIAASSSVTHERIRQIVYRALRRLREPTVTKRLLPFTEIG